MRSSDGAIKKTQKKGSKKTEPFFVFVVVENFDAILASSSLARRLVRARMSPPALSLARARKSPPAGRIIRVHRAAEPFVLLAPKKKSSKSVP